MHLTIGTLLLHKEEIGKVEKDLKEITEQFIQMKDSTFGLIITFEGIGWGDGGTAVLFGPRSRLGIKLLTCLERW